VTSFVSYLYVLLFFFVCTVRRNAGAKIAVRLAGHYLGQYNGRLTLVDMDPFFVGFAFGAGIYQVISTD